MKVERFIKEYANNIKKGYIARTEEDKAYAFNKIDKTVLLRERGLISVDECIYALLKISSPQYFD